MPEEQAIPPALPPDEAGYCYGYSEFTSAVRAAVLRKRGTMSPLVLLAPSIMLMVVALLGAFYVLLGNSVDSTLFLALSIALVAPYAFPLFRLRVRDRHVREFIADRCCFHCGYACRELTTDADGFGTCPECGRRFNIGEYREPPRGYVRLHHPPRDWKESLHPLDQARFQDSD